MLLKEALKASRLQQASRQHAHLLIQAHRVFISSFHPTQIHEATLSPSVTAALMQSEGLHVQ